MQITLIFCYIILECVEMLGYTKAKNMHEYIDVSIQRFYRSKISFIALNANFLYILFLVFALDIHGVGIIIAAICKFCDIAMRLWFINKESMLDFLGDTLRAIPLTSSLKVANGLMYIALVGAVIFVLFATQIDIMLQKAQGFRHV